MRDKAESVWRYIALFVAGVAVTLAGAWAVQAKETVSREEVSTMIQTESPYVPDQALVRSMVGKVDNISEQQTAILEDLAAIKAELRIRE